MLELLFFVVFLAEMTKQNYWEVNVFIKKR